MASGLKSIQRGVAGGAGTITINRVDMNKTVVYSASKASAGTAAVTGTLALTPSGYTNPATAGNGQGSINSVNVTQPTLSGAVSGGTTNLTTALYSAKLTGPTTLSCDGAVEWQVVEYF